MVQEGRALFLEGFKFFLSGVTDADQTKARKVIHALGGNCCEHYSDREVNCLLVRRVGSVGYASALRASTPILVLQWLYDCYVQKKLLAFKLYNVKPFQGLYVSCSQLLPEDRFRVQRIVEENGGNFNSSLVKGQCTHLVAVSAEGEKYCYAKSWRNVMIVTIDWVLECERIKSWAPEIKYLVKKSTSQPAPTNQSHLAAAATSENTAAIEQQKKRPRREPENLVANMESLLTSCDYDKRALQKLIRSSAPSDVLRNQLFWVFGFEREVHDIIIELIALGGGRRSMVLYDGVTVVLLGPKAQPQHYQEVRRHPCGVICANFVWLADQLFSARGVLELIEDVPTFADLVRYVQLQHDAVADMDAFVRLYLQWFDEREQREERQSAQQISAVQNQSVVTYAVDCMASVVAGDGDVREEGGEVKQRESESLYQFEEDDPMLEKLLASSGAKSRERSQSKSRPAGRNSLPNWRSKMADNMRAPLSTATNLPMLPPRGSLPSSSTGVNSVDNGSREIVGTKRGHGASTVDEDSQQITYNDGAVANNIFL